MNSIKRLLAFLAIFALLSCLITLMAAEQAGSSIVGYEKTSGDKKVAWVRLLCASETADVSKTSDAEITALIAAQNQFYYKQSHGKTSLTLSLITDELSLAQTASYYKSNRTALQNDSRTAFANAGFTRGDYDIIIYESAGADGAWAFIGQEEAWFKKASFLGLDHEIGHLYGFSHADLWWADNPLGAGMRVEYANYFDSMGISSEDYKGFNVFYREQAGWIDEGEEIVTAYHSQSYTIYDFRDVV